jgi:ABC-2 type transport system ATP-binding protein
LTNNQQSALRAWGSPTRRRVVGAVLDAGGFHHARKARAHLRCYAAAISIPQEGAC